MGLARQAEMVMVRGCCEPTKMPSQDTLKDMHA
jgi:hypothetical protein